MVENLASAIECYSYLQPLRIGTGNTPFNFPAMIPLRTFLMPIARGNTFVLKLSEHDPVTSCNLTELFAEADAPR